MTARDEPTCGECGGDERHEPGCSYSNGPFEPATPPEPSAEPATCGAQHPDEQTGFACLLARGHLGMCQNGGTTWIAYALDGSRVAPTPGAPARPVPGPTCGEPVFGWPGEALCTRQRGHEPPCWHEQPVAPVGRPPLCTGCQRHVPCTQFPPGCLAMQKWFDAGAASRQAEVEQLTRMLDAERKRREGWRKQYYDAETEVDATRAALTAEREARARAEAERYALADECRRVGAQFDDYASQLHATCGELATVRAAREAERAAAGELLEAGETLRKYAEVAVDMMNVDNSKRRFVLMASMRWAAARSKVPATQGGEGDGKL